MTLSLCDWPIHTMLYCIEYLLSLRGDLNDPADKDTAYFIQAEMNLNLLKVWSVFDLQGCPEKELVTSACLRCCRRLCSIISWVATSSSKPPPDVSTSITVLLDADSIMNTVERSRHVTRDLHLQHANYLPLTWLKTARELYTITPRASL